MRFSTSCVLRQRTAWLSCILCAIILLIGNIAHAQSTAFTYQGKLSDAGSPATGTYDLEFKLFDAANTQIGTSITREDVQVTSGSFTVTLDFGQSPFVNNAASTLEIGVRPGTSTGPFTTLAPRQPITNSPYSIQTVNAQQLGGVAADQYVKTDDPRLGGPGGNFIQNTTTQQPSANFNIAGNGIVGGTVGIGTTTPGVGLKLDVNGLARFMPGGAGGAIQLGSPNSETGITISNASTRADLRFDGSTFKLVAGPAGGPPSSANGVVVTSTGLVGVGTANPNIGRFNVNSLGNEPGIFSTSANRGVWGISTGSSYGVYGESVDGIGAQGISTNNIGLSGLSTSNLGVFGSSNSKSGVFGQTAALNGLGVQAAGVWGVGPNSNAPFQSGIGVRGDGFTGVQGQGRTGVSGFSSADGGIGVSGSSSGVGGTAVQGFETGQATSGIAVYGISFNGTGVRGSSSSGFAMYAEGNAGQSPDKNGFVKAMIHVDRNGAILRCYNGVTNSSSGASCATVTLPLGNVGAYQISFASLPANSRFISITPQYSTTCNTVPIQCHNAGANFVINGDGSIGVFTFNADNAQDTAEAAFMLVVY